MKQVAMMEQFFEKARTCPQRIAFPEADDKKMLAAAYETASAGFGACYLVGDGKALRALCREQGIDESIFHFIDSNDEALRDQLVERYLESSTGMYGKNTLTRRMSNPLYFAMVMQAIGEVDTTIGGLSATTADVIRVAVEILGMKEGGVISSIALCQVPGHGSSEGETLVLADCGVCPNPDASELASIAIDSCDTVRDLLGWTPRCALLSFSTTGSASHDMVEKVTEALRLANQRRPDLMIDGEFQLDAALDPVVAKKKVKRESKVAGQANILIFPDLNAGNIGAKILQRFGGAEVYGPLLQGFKQVCTDSSRGASVSELVGNIALTVVRAAAQGQERQTLSFAYDNMVSTTR